MNGYSRIRLCTLNKLILRFTTVAIWGTSFAFGQGAPPHACKDSLTPIEQIKLSSFEVASIRLNQSSSGGGGYRDFPDRFTAANITLQRLIEFAYDLREFQLSGGPAWIKSETYDIDAKKEDGADTLCPNLRQKQTKIMLRSLLLERLKLNLDKKTKELPAYALVVARGAKIRESTSEDSSLANNPNNESHKTSGTARERRGEIVGDGVSIGTLAKLLSDQLGRDVIDETKLSGAYNFTLQWTPDQDNRQFNAADENNRIMTSTPADAAPPPIFTAIQDQLGLKLEPVKKIADIFIIDSVEKPSEN